MTDLDAIDRMVAEAEAAPILWTSRAAFLWNAYPAIAAELREARKRVLELEAEIEVRDNCTTETMRILREAMPNRGFYSEMEAAEAAKGEIRRPEQANGDLRRERDRAVADAKRDAEVAKGLRKERDAATERAEKAERELQEKAAAFEIGREGWKQRAEAAEAEVNAVLERYADPHENQTLAEFVEELYKSCATAWAERDALRAEVDTLKNALMVSEQYRKAYQDGKHKLYEMGGEILAAAADHLPCGEGTLDSYSIKIEREHSPQLTQRLIEALNDRDAFARQNAALRAALEVVRRRLKLHGFTPCAEVNNALAITPPAALDDLRRREREAALRDVADLIRQTTPDATDDEFSKGKYDGRIYAIEQIEAMADALAAERDHIADAGKKAGELEHCAADIDGECDHAKCPQLRDGEPGKTGRHCPLDSRTRDGFTAERKEGE